MMERSDLIREVASIAGMTATWVLGGHALLPAPIRRRSNVPLVAATALALGAGINAMVLTLLAILRQFRPGPIAIVAASGFVIALLVGRGGVVAWWQEKPNSPVRGVDRVGLAVLAVLLLATLFASFAPPSSMDAIVYHLRVPRAFLRTGTWSKLGVVQSFQPLYVEMLFGEGLVLGGGPAAAMVHWVLGLGAILASAAWAKRLGGSAVWASVIFGASGLYVWESTSAFIDLGLALFSSLAFFWAADLEDDRRSSLLAGVFAGLAAGSKFTGLIVACLAGLAALAVVWPDWRRGARRLAVLGAVAAIVTVPWYLRNVILTGNPIYPLANPLFGGPRVSFSTHSYGYGRDLLHLLSSPFDLLARGGPFDQGWSLGAAVLALAPIGIWARRSRLAYVAAASIGAWWIIWFVSSPQTRLLLPLLPMAAGLAGVGVEAVKRNGSGTVRVVTILLLAVTVLGGAAAAGLAVRMSARVVVGLESKDAYLERNSWNYPAYEQVNRLVPEEAKMASIGGGNNLYYVQRDIDFLGGDEPAASQLRAAGFTHELWIGLCRSTALESAGRRTMAEGAYDLRASRLTGGVFAHSCYRLSELDR